MLKQVPVSHENSNLDPQGPVATGNLDLQVRVFAGIPMGKPTGNPQGPGPMLSPNNNMNAWKDKTDVWQSRMNIWYLLCVWPYCGMLNKYT